MLLPAPYCLLAVLLLRTVLTLGLSDLAYKFWLSSSPPFLWSGLYIIKYRGESKINNLNEHDLVALCRKWQDLLRLAHWNIAIRVAPIENMPLPHSQAANHISLATEKALISILDYHDFPDGIFQQDLEVSIVHELLHIPLMYFAHPDVDSIEFTLMEAFIEATAKLLVDLARKADVHDTD